MAQRKPIAARRSCVLYIVVLAALILIIAGMALVLVVLPEQDRQRQAERHYQAGVAFQNTGDLDKAKSEYEQVITIDASYKDVQTRLADVQEQRKAYHYQRGLDYVNTGQYAEAVEEFKIVMGLDTRYEDVQARLKEAEAKLAEVRALTPTAAPIPTATPAPTDTPTPAITSTPSNTPIVTSALDNTSTPTPTPTPDWCEDLNIVNVEASGFFEGNYPQNAVDFDHTGCQIQNSTWVAPNQNGWIRLTLRGGHKISTIVIDPSTTSGIPGEVRILAGPASDDLRAVGAYYGAWNQHQLLIIRLFDPFKEDDRIIQINAYHGKEWVVIYRITWW